MTRSLTRLPDWQLRLDALVRERRGQAFAWGARDCCLWGADVVLAVTGREKGDAAHREHDEHGEDPHHGVRHPRLLRRACRARRP